MEKTGCKITCGAPTTLGVKGLMMIMKRKFTTMNNTLTDRVVDSDTDSLFTLDVVLNLNSVRVYALFYFVVSYYLVNYILHRRLN